MRALIIAVALLAAVLAMTGSFSGKRLFLTASEASGQEVGQPTVPQIAAACLMIPERIHKRLGEEFPSRSEVASAFARGAPDFLMVSVNLTDKSCTQLVVTEEKPHIKRKDGRASAALILDLKGMRGQLMPAYVLVEVEPAAEGLRTFMLTVVFLNARPDRGSTQIA